MKEWKSLNELPASSSVLKEDLDQVVVETFFSDSSKLVDNLQLIIAKCEVENYLIRIRDMSYWDKNTADANSI